MGAEGGSEAVPGQSKLMTKDAARHRAHSWIGAHRV